MGASQVDILGISIPYEGNGKYKGPEGSVVNMSKEDNSMKW